MVTGVLHIDNIFIHICYRALHQIITTGMYYIFSNISWLIPFSCHCRVFISHRQIIQWTKMLLTKRLFSSLLQEWWSTSLEVTRWLITLMVQRERPTRLTLLPHSEEWAWHTTWRRSWESNSLRLTATTVMVKLKTSFFFLWGDCSASLTLFLLIYSLTLPFEM